MAAAEEFNRIGFRADEEFRVDTGRNGSGRNEPDEFGPKPVLPVRESAPRTLGSPLPMGSTPRSQGRTEGQPSRPNAAPPGRALSVPANSEPDASSVMQWAMGFVKQAVPFVQKLLPLLDGQIATAAANLLANRPHTPPPQPRVDLTPIENRIGEMQLQQANFKDQLADHSTSLKRVEDQLEMVREATDRNTLEQQELIEDLKAVGSRVNLLALLFLSLLVISVILNIVMFLHIQRNIP
jgi:hypothetical protein